MPPASATSSSRLRHLAPAALAIGLLLAAYASLVLYYKHHYPAGDPDRWYHYAISKLTAAHGLLFTLPQVEDLGWGQRFPDKEFLFHALTTLAYRLGGESAVDFTAYALGFSCFLLLLIYLARRSGWLVSTTLVIGLGLCNPYFSGRMVLLRPHLLAVLAFIAIAIGLLEEIPLLAAIGGAVFALSYHAFFVPLAFLAIAALTSLATLGRTWDRLNKSILFGFLGLVGGYVFTPYFPGNLKMGWEHLQIALFFSTPLPGVTPGGELISLPLVQSLLAFWPELFALAFVASVLVRTRKKIDPRSWFRIAALLASASFFLLLAFKSPRSSEYAIPLTLLSLVFALEQRGLQRKWLPRLLWVAFVPSFLFMLAVYASPPNAVAAAFEEAIVEGVQAIPQTPGKKVFTCNWNLGAYLLYARPDLRFIDLLDPRLLLFESVEKFEAIRNAKLGNVQDMYGLVTAFRSDYVFCDNPVFNAAIERDPRFTLLYAAPAGDVEGQRFRPPVRVYRRE